MANVKNTRTGKFASVPNHYIGHPVLGEDLIVVDDEFEAAPKKEKKIKSEVRGFSWSKTEETKEQPAPETTIENEEHEDAH